MSDVIQDMNTQSYARQEGRVRKKGPEWHCLRNQAPKEWVCSQCSAFGFLIISPWFILWVICIYAKSMQKTVWLEQQWFAPCCQKGKWALEPHGSEESGLQQCHLITHGTQTIAVQTTSLSSLSDLLKLIPSPSCLSTSQGDAEDKEMGRGDRLWSEKDGNCFSQNRYKLENHALVTCSIKLESAGWFIVTVLVVTYVLKARIPDPVTASELHLYRQMGAAVRHFYLEGRKE